MMNFQTDIIIQNMQPFLSVMIGGFALATLLIVMTYGISKCLSLFNII